LEGVQAKAKDIQTQVGRLRLSVTASLFGIDLFKAFGIINHVCLNGQTENVNRLWYQPGGE
jgi:hypothetical protein